MDSNKKIYIDLIRARNEINIAWIKLDEAITRYNIIDEQLRVSLGLKNKTTKTKKKTK